MIYFFLNFKQLTMHDNVVYKYEFYTIHVILHHNYNECYSIRVHERVKVVPRS